jgi:SAM-dependent methyltransferase
MAGERRSVDDLNPAGRFSSRVENYVRCRPGYPPGVIALLRQVCSLTRDSVVADVGSGTGIFTRPLIDGGCLVYAVEPNAEMRAQAERESGGAPNFRSVAAPAEATGLPDRSIDLIVAAQAAHWFDVPRANAEFRRIARPGAWLALIWNIRRTDSTPFLREYEALIERHGTDYKQVSANQGSEAVVRGLFAPAPYSEFMFDNRQHFDAEGLIGRALSSSYVPQPGHLACEPMLSELRELFQRHERDGLVTFEYDTRVYLGRL